MNYEWNIDGCQFVWNTIHMPLAELIPVTDLNACSTSIVREPISTAQARELAHLMKAVSDPARLRLISIVAAHSGTEACVCDLTEPLGLSQGTVSHHLKILVGAGILGREKRGTWAYYRLVPGALDSIARSLVSA